MIMSSPSVHISDQHPFARKIEHRRGRGVLLGLSLLFGLLVLGGCEAGQQSTPGYPL